MVKIKPNKILLGGMILGVFLVLRLYKLDERINFSMDQGITMIRAWEIWKNKEITLLGPVASPMVNGKHFFFGPITYYVFAVLGAITKFDPIAIGYILSIIGAISLGIYFLATKNLWGEKTAWIAAILWAIYPVFSDLNPIIWNINLLILMLPVWLWLVGKLQKNKRYVVFTGIGLVLGIMLQLHYQTVIAIVISGFVMMNAKVKQWLAATIGGVVGFMPLILFDLRNDFYNSRTFFEWLTSDNTEGFGIHKLYFLVITPLIIWGIARLIDKMGRGVTWLLIGLMVLTVVIKVNEKSAPGMPNNWTYTNLEEVVKIVINEGCEKRFNISETISGDSRAYAIRSRLIAKQCKPLGEEGYEEIETLYVVAPMDRPVENDNLWEIRAMGKSIVEKEFTINSKVKLYKLVKIIQPEEITIF